MESVTGVYRLRFISYLLSKTGLPFFTPWHRAPLSHVRLCNPMDCNPPDCSVHKILQARILEWVAISFSRESSQPRDQTQASCITSRRHKEAAFLPQRMLFFFFNLITTDLSKPIPVSQKNEICSSTSIFVFPSLPPFPRPTPIISDSAFLFQLVVAFMTSHFQSYYE